MNDRIPERPLQPPHDLGESIPFNEYDEGIMHDVVGNKRLAKPIQELLEILCAITAVNGSFGDDTINKAKAFDQILPQLKALREACVDEWRDM